MHIVPTQHHGSEEIAAFLTNALISGIIYEKDTKKICLRNPPGVIVGLQLRAQGSIAC